MDILHVFANETINQLESLPILGGNDAFKNQWEEFCWHCQGDSIELGLWEDFVIDKIAIEMDSHSDLERLEAWLSTDQGADYLYEKFNCFIDLKYLNFTELSKEMGSNSDDIVIAVFNNIKSKAADYQLPDY